MAIKPTGRSDDVRDYVLITPARNEEAFIEKTIESMTRQTVLPKKWIIVSDGSTDRTDAIVEWHAQRHGWIELVRLSPGRRRSFAAKVDAFNVGYERVKGMVYSVIGNIDADVSFDAAYMEFLLGKFKEVSDLGVAGTPFIEEGYSSLEDSFEGERHVAGACQLFRRECFEEIGGYTPVPRGGVDWICVLTARMKGWKTRSFSEKQFHHHRKLGHGSRKNPVAVSFDYGVRDYYFGSHPCWQMCRVAYAMIRKPFILQGTALLLGYLWGAAKRMDRPISRELIAFHRREQMEKLKTILLACFRLKKVDRFRLMRERGR